MLGAVIREMRGAAGASICNRQVLTAPALVHNVHYFLPTSCFLQLLCATECEAVDDDWSQLAPLFCALAAHCR